MSTQKKESGWCCLYKQVLITSAICFLLICLPVSLVFPKSDDEVLSKERFVHAYSYYQSDRYSDAHQAFAELLKEYPDSAFSDAALFLQGECLLLQGMYPEAIETYRQVLKEATTDRFQDDAWYRIGDVYYRLGGFDEAK